MVEASRIYVFEEPRGLQVFREYSTDDFGGTFPAVGDVIVDRSDMQNPRLLEVRQRYFTTASQPLTHFACLVVHPRDAAESERDILA